mmetsp:Transcript_19101/g.31827  ORF Transcript_19101/g.31827 Transcript_19101/m.31827 type:complete len:292 (+) Transcript_19101:14-889(+)
MIFGKIALVGMSGVVGVSAGSLGMSNSVRVGDPTTINAMHWTPESACFENSDCRTGAVEYLGKFLKSSNYDFISLSNWTTGENITAPYPDYKTYETTNCGVKQVLVYKSSVWRPSTKVTKLCLDKPGAVIAVQFASGDVTSPNNVTVLSAYFSDKTQTSIGKIKSLGKDASNDLDFNRLLVLADTRLVTSTKEPGMKDEDIFKGIDASTKTIVSTAGKETTTTSAVDPVTCCVKVQSTDQAFSRIIANLGSFKSDTDGAKYGFNQDGTWGGPKWISQDKMQRPVFLQFTQS